MTGEEERNDRVTGNIAVYNMLRAGVTTDDYSIQYTPLFIPLNLIESDLMPSDDKFQHPTDQGIINI